MLPELPSSADVRDYKDCVLHDFGCWTPTTSERRPLVPTVTGPAAATSAPLHLLQERRACRHSPRLWVEAAALGLQRFSAVQAFETLSQASNMCPELCGHSRIPGQNDNDVNQSCRSWTGMRHSTWSFGKRWRRSRSMSWRRRNGRRRSTGRGCGGRRRRRTCSAARRAGTPPSTPTSPLCWQASTVAPFLHLSPSPWVGASLHCTGWRLYGLRDVMRMSLANTEAAVCSLLPNNIYSPTPHACQQIINPKGTCSGSCWSHRVDQRYSSETGNVVKALIPAGNMRWEPLELEELTNGHLLLGRF